MLPPSPWLGSTGTHAISQTTTNVVFDQTHFSSRKGVWLNSLAHHIRDWYQINLTGSLSCWCFKQIFLFDLCLFFEFYTVCIGITFKCVNHLLSQGEPIYLPWYVCVGQGGGPTDAQVRGHGGHRCDRIRPAGPCTEPGFKPGNTSSYSSHLTVRKLVMRLW